MELFRGLQSLPPVRETGPGPCVATIGVFDGVHLGHERVIDSLMTEAEHLELPASVMVFEPSPREYFKGEQAPARLTRFGEKYRLLEKTGIDRLVCLRFDRQLASLSAADFVDRLLIDGMQIRHLIVGDDFRFGHEREGDFAYLKTAGQRFGFNVDETERVDLEGARISSSRIREALREGRMGEASACLGRPYSIQGRVVEGQRLGRKLGFPTINIRLRRRVCAVHGIFAVRVHGNGLDGRPGVASVGHRPTVAGDELLLEVHLFDFAGDLYGKQLKVELLHKIRDEHRFAGLPELTEAMKHDAAQARRLLNLTESESMA